MDPFEKFLREYDPMKPDLNPDDIVFFLNDYGQIRFDSPTRALRMSEVILHEHNVVIPFGRWNEMTNEVRIQKMRNIFKLCKHQLLQVQLIKFRLPKEITELLNTDYKVKKGEHYVRIYPDERPTNWFEKLIERIFGPGFFTPKLGGYHFMEFINDNYEFLMENVVLKANFDLKVYDTCFFFDQAMKCVKPKVPGTEKRKQGLRLYEEISQRIGGATNYGGKIELAYPIRKYAESCGFYHEILDELHVQQKINIAARYIEGQYVNFVIEKIVDLDKKDFIFDSEGDKSEPIGQSQYDPVNRILTVGGKSFEFTKNSKSADVLKLAYSIRDKTGKPFISMGELGDEFESRKNEFRNVSQKDLNYDSLNGMFKQRLAKIRMELGTKKKIIGLSTSGLELDC